LENKSGRYVEATAASGQAALASAQLPDDLIVWASDPEAQDAYPIVTYSSFGTSETRGVLNRLVRGLSYRFHKVSANVSIFAF
jgi:hypothetical protein